MLPPQRKSFEHPIADALLDPYAPLSPTPPGVGGSPRGGYPGRPRPVVYFNPPPPPPPLSLGVSCRQFRQDRKMDSDSGEGTSIGPSSPRRESSTTEPNWQDVREADRGTQFIDFEPRTVSPTGFSGKYGTVFVRFPPHRFKLYCGNAKLRLLRRTIHDTDDPRMKLGVVGYDFELPTQQEVGSECARLVLEVPGKDYVWSDGKMKFRGVLLGGGGGLHDGDDLWPQFLLRWTSDGLVQAVLHFVRIRINEKNFLHDGVSHGRFATPDSPEYTNLESILDLRIPQLRAMLRERDNFGNRPIDYGSGPVVALLIRHGSPPRDARNGYSTKGLDDFLQDLEQEEMRMGTELQDAGHDAF